MNNDLANFYATAAQVIPALLILLVIESRFMAAIQAYRGLESASDEVVTAVEFAERALRTIMPVLPGGRLSMWTVRFFYLRPTRLSNNILIVGTVVWPLVGEGLAFGSLIHTPVGTAKRLVVVAICLALAILVVEALIALLWLSLSSANSASEDLAPTSARASTVSVDSKPTRRSASPEPLPNVLPSEETNLPM